MIHLPEFSLLKLTGNDRENFLQGLTTNNIVTLEKHHAQFSLILTPQGKYIFDFFIYKSDDALFLECRKNQKSELLKKLSLYRLKSDVQWEELPHSIYAFFGSEEEAQKIAQEKDGYAYVDPRHPEMGTRVIVTTLIESAADQKSYHVKRIALGLAEGEHDMKLAQAFPLDFGMEEQHAIDFKKGCYVGQEVTARSHYRGVIKKTVCTIHSAQTLPHHGTPLHNSEGVTIGEILSSVETQGLALVRKEEVKEKMEVEEREGRWWII